MVKFHELGMGVNAKSKSVIAKASYQNGAIGTVNASGEFVLSSNKADYILLDVETGDDAGVSDYKVKAGANVKVYPLVDGVYDVTPESFEFYGSNTYGNLSAGTSIFGVSSANGKFVGISTQPTASGSVYFTLVNKIQFNGNGISVEKKTV